MEERIDKILMERGLVSTRVRAEEIVKKFGVKVNGKLFSKPGKKVPTDAVIELMAEEIPWVSRAAFKLIAALDHWKIEVKEQTFMDLGASTGGFTEVLLSRDLKRSYCVDVGQKQLPERIKNDPKVVNLEKTHARDLTEKLIPEPNSNCGLINKMTFAFGLRKEIVKGSTFSSEIKDTSTTRPSRGSGINFSVKSRACVFSKLT
ncbi:MAG: SAM-dependent methyltransferase, partial [Flavobacteriales bacterium]